MVDVATYAGGVADPVEADDTITLGDAVAVYAGTVVDPVAEPTIPVTDAAADASKTSP